MVRFLIALAAALVLSVTAIHGANEARAACAPREMAAGAQESLPAGCVVVGDIVVDGGPRHDDDEKTQMVVLLQQDAHVSFPFGGSIDDASNLDAIVAGKTLQTGDVIVVGEASPPPPPPPSGTTVVACEERSVAAGETLVVSAGCSAIGDVSLGPEGVKAHDDDPETGTIVTCTSDACQVVFPFGGSISGRPVAELVAEAKAGGCGGGCRTVHHVCWPQACGQQNVSPGGGTAASGEGVVGEISRGTISMIVFMGSSPDQLIAESGCSPQTVVFWTIVGGRWEFLIPALPEVGNFPQSITQPLGVVVVGC